MRPLALLACMIPLACGPKEGSDDSSSATDAAATPAGGSGEAGAPTDGGATDPPITGTSATDASTTDASATDASATTPLTTTVEPDTTSGDACAEYEDAIPVPEVVISLQNDSAAPVFLFHVHFCAPVQLVEISAPDSDQPLQWMDSICDFTCGEALTGNCGACPPFCPEDKVLMIAPGGRHSFAWTGSVFSQAALSLACGAAECGDTCLKVSQAANADYKLVARASSSAIICADPNMCTCVPNQEGWCDVMASGIGADVKLAEGTLEYPNEQSITLTFTD